MEKTIAIAIFLLIATAGFGQIIPSSCNAPDSIISKYIDDADRMAVRRIFRNNWVYKDSIEIPGAYSDTILNALLAVYNAASLTERDTVVTLLDLHTFPDTPVNGLFIDVDTALGWVVALKNGIFPTGDATIDTLFTRYEIQLDRYGYSFGRRVSITFNTGRNMNIKALTPILDTIPGIYWVSDRWVIGDGYNITDSVFNDRVELVYYKGWWGCPSGCTGKRFWKFNVYDDCSVEFVKSWGGQVPLYNQVTENMPSSIAVYPNPFKNIIRLDGDTEDHLYALKNVAGQTVAHGRVTNHQIAGLEKLPPGVYFLGLQLEARYPTFKLVKL